MPTPSVECPVCRQCGMCDAEVGELASVAAVGMVGEAVIADGEAAEDPPLPSVASLISRDEQLGDGDLRQLLDLKSTCQEPPPVSDFVSASPALKTLLTFWPFIEVRDGVLYRRKPSSNSDSPCYQVLVPADLTQ